MKKKEPRKDNPPKGHDEAVKACYSTWSCSYYDDYYRSGQAYPPVHRDLVKGLLAGPEIKSLLDAGCGPASMLRDLVRSGLEVFGFDLTPEMILEARRILGDLGVPADNVWEGSVLDKADFFRKTPAGGLFDAAVCFGVLPHVRPEDDQAVLTNLIQAVRPGGLVLVEARNQFFSLYTLNRPSRDFFLHDLVRADRLSDHAGTDQAFLEEALAKLAGMFRLDLPPVRQGREGQPGYDEILSRTHNPFVLKKQAEETGWCEVETLFYHYHCLPPMFEALVPDLFRRESLAMEDPRDWRGYFMASAFILCGKRR